MESLAQRKICDTCGLSMDFDMPSGFCPACLLTTALERSQTLAAGSCIEDYELLNEIARGGMGIVYRARQHAPSRVVALKMILPTHLSSLGAVQRFRAEAETAASLEHENILPIYAVGEHDGAPFYSMKFAEGGTLSARIDNYRDKPRQAAALVAKLTRAVAFAHEHGILHRDLKPGNVLFDSADKPYVSDFGLAKWLQRECDLTQTLAILGTPYYMAPEQATDSRGVTAAADIYSLGAILYHLLAGRPPIWGETPMEVLHRAAAEKPKSPRITNGRISRDLETICLKCLEKEPAARYASASALADDLERWLKHQPIHARRTGIFARGKKWVRRNPTSALLAASLVALAVAVGWNVWKSELIHRPPTTGIAVLPFENLSEQTQDNAFVDGLQDDILTKLAKIADLKVISRTSVMEYRGKRNMREIGGALGVSHVLEGSAQRSGNKIHLNAQLIDTRTDTHVWAEQYDRDLTDLFAIQSEIAKTIADQLRATLSPREKTAIEQAPTSDVSAFDLYTQAKDLILKSGTATSKKTDLLHAIELLNQAVARDPSFLQAYYEIASAHDRLYALGLDHSSARLALADAAVAAASRLRPDAGETHVTRARNLYWGYLDYDGALAELEMARRTLPNSHQVFELTGFIKRRQGKTEEALRNFERAFELDPRNIYILDEIAVTYSCLRRYPEAAAAYDRALAIKPHDVQMKVFRAEVELDLKADTQPLHQAIDSLRAEQPGAIQGVAGHWLHCALAERDTAAAEAALDALGGNPWGENPMFFSRSFTEGLIARMMKDETKAHAAFTAARAEQIKIVQAQPDYAPALCMLGLIDAGLGRKEEALREGRQATELVPVTKNYQDGVYMIEYYSCIAAWVGEKDLACEQLTKATAHGAPTYGDLKLSPFWNPLRGDPRFEKIVASVAPKE